MLKSYLPALVFLLLGLGVGVAFTFANDLLGPKRPRPVKTEPYESGLPSDVKKSFRFGICFYLVAMLFILFDIEVVFLYPVALQLEAFGISRWWRRSCSSCFCSWPSCSCGEGERSNGSDPPARPTDMRVRQLRAQQMLRGDLEGDDLEKYVEERVLLTRMENAQNWARANALFPLGFGLACCAIEMITVIGSPRNDLSRFGAEVIRFTPRQADLLILSGRVSIKMAPIIRRLYDQMLEPKWVIAMGACSSSAGMFNNYAVVAGADKFLPVDVYVPGCPPRPEALIFGINRLQDKIKGEPDMGWRERYKRRARGKLPDATGLELIAQRVREALDDDAVTGTLVQREQATLEVAPARVREVLSYLRDGDEEPWPRS